jgi:hypothetical protein
MILQSNTKSWAWRCDTPGCTDPRSCGAGYGSDHAAKQAQDRHAATTHPIRAAAEPTAAVLVLAPSAVKADQSVWSRLPLGVAA